MCGSEVFAGMSESSWSSLVGRNCRVGAGKKAPSVVGPRVEQLSLASASALKQCPRSSKVRRYTKENAFLQSSDVFNIFAISLLVQSCLKLLRSLHEVLERTLCLARSFVLQFPRFLHDNSGTDNPPTSPHKKKSK